MACGYHKTGMSSQEAVFHLFFRKHPFDGGFTVAAGLGEAITALESWRYAPDELAYLRGLRGNDGAALFDESFPRYPGRLGMGLRRGRGAGGHGRFPQRPDPARARAALAGATRRNAPEPPQLPEPRRHQGGARLPRGGRRGRAGIRPAARAGTRRRAGGQPGGVRRRGGGDEQRPGRDALRHPRARHARAQLGDGLRLGAGGVRGVCGGAAEQRRFPRGHLRHAGRRAPRGRGRGESCASAATGWRACGWTRATSPT